MALPRRALLAAPLLLCMPAAARAASAMLRPGLSSALGFSPLPQERLAFHADGLGPTITLPAARARLAGLLPVAGRQVAVLAFGADPAEGGGFLDLAGFVGWDGAVLRVLALEVLSWRAPGGSALGTRWRATGDRTRLLLMRDAAAPRGPRLWRRESWIDTLLWRDGAALADAPPRPPLAGTWQAELAAARARVAARLAQPCADIEEDLIALLAPASLPPA